MIEAPIFNPLNIFIRTFRGTQVLLLLTWFLSRPLTIRVLFFRLFGFNKATLEQKGQKGATQEPNLGPYAGAGAAEADTDSSSYE